MYKYAVSIILLFACLGLAAKNDVLTLDRVDVSKVKFAFENDSNVFPDESDFAIEHFVLMSNTNGERWGILTITNQSSGRRELQAKHIMALFADGSRYSPVKLKQPFNGYETQSITLNFGENKFPILSVYTRN
jgi:hypothetical protein